MLNLLYLRYETNIKTVVLVCTLISIVQGFILTLLLIEYFATSKQVILGFTNITPITFSSLLYSSFLEFLTLFICSRLNARAQSLMIKIFFNILLGYLEQQNIKLKLFGGKHSFNAFVIPISVLNRKHIKIFVGRDLLNETNLAEILFVIWTRIFASSR